MIRTTLMILSLLFFAGAAQAEVFKIGQGVTTSHQGKTYFDTYPGEFCGVKSIAIEVNGAPYGGLVYFSYTPNKPWIFSAKANVGGGWNKVPKIKGTDCLQRVRVYVPGAYPPPDEDDQVQTYFFTVYGKK